MPEEGKKSRKQMNNKVPRDNAAGQASIYTSDGVPMIGCNFAALQDLSKNKRTNLRMDAMIHYETLFSVPVDDNDSFFQKMSELYTEIREANTGASNYDPTVLMAYVANVLQLRAIFTELYKMQQATRAVAPGARQSALIVGAACGVYNHKAYAETWADKYNELAILAKEIETLPIPPLPVLQRIQEVFGTLYTDSNSAKPSYIGFHLMGSFVYKLAGSTATGFTIKPEYTARVTATPWTAFTAQARKILDHIYDATLPYTILRGDLRRAFGAQAMRYDLLSKLSEPLKVVPDSAGIMSQLENAALFPTKLTQWDDSTIEHTLDSAGVATLRIKVATYVDVKGVSKMEQANQLINWHGVKEPTPAQLCQITRFMYLGAHLNQATASYYDITSTDGFTIAGARAIEEITDSSFSWRVLTNTMSLAQTGDGDALRIMMYYASVVEHFPFFYTVEDTSEVDTGYEYVWNLDNFAIISDTDLATINTRVVRSLYNVHLPRGSAGRIEKKSQTQSHSTAKC